MDFMPQGEMMGFNMHFIHPWGDPGGVYEYNQPCLADIGETVTFNFEVKGTPPAKELVPCLFLAKKGDANKITRQVKLPRIKIESSARGGKPKKSNPVAKAINFEPQTKDFGWCSVTVPGAVKKGGSVEVAVTLKTALAAGENLSCHLHHTKEDGSWGGPYAIVAPATPSPGETVKFTFTAGKPCLELCPVLFAAPNGNFNQATKRINAQKISFYTPPPSAAEIARRQAAEEAARGSNEEA